jgi:hypothetical protein
MLNKLDWVIVFLVAGIIFAVGFLCAYNQPREIYVEKPAVKKTIDSETAGKKVGEGSGRFGGSFLKYAIKGFLHGLGH